MSDGDDLVLWCALSRLMATYWADVDENGGLQAHEFYLPDGLYAIGTNRFEGRDKIEAFYARRRHGSVMTRHLLCNLRISGDEEPRTWIAGMVSLYRADGKSPFQGARPPAMISKRGACSAPTGDGGFNRMCCGRLSSAPTCRPRS
jgi:hypothetical protein